LITEGGGLDHRGRLLSPLPDALTRLVAASRALGGRPFRDPFAGQSGLDQAGGCSLGWVSRRLGLVRDLSPGNPERVR
jgi:hypothetical protein